MHVCIVYDTKQEKGATKQIVEWMMEELKTISDIRVDVKRPWEVENFDYDLFVVGSPIYWEKPMKSIVNFLSFNRDNLKNRKVAVFILCLAEAFGKYTKGYIEAQYLKPLEKEVLNSLIESGVFRGWLRNPDYRQKQICSKWIRKVIEKAKAAKRESITNGVVAL
ncbi:MAG: hypothetical protein J7K82_00830 [Thermoproteales archaeon]|nr:hypothetical protein [Thermoproteales archaeon]